MKAFLSEIVDRILKDAWPLDQTVWIFPSKRAGTFAKNYLRQHISQTVFAPQFYSIEEFITEISKLTVCDSESSLCLLYEAYLESSIKNKDSFVNFVPWGSMLLQDFNEIDRYAVDAQKLYTYIQNLQEVSHWALDENPSDLVKNYLSFWEQLPSIYNCFTAKMLEHDMGHQGLLYKKAAQRLPTYLEEQPQKKIYFIGFNALNTSESQMIREVLKQKRGTIYWDIDHYFLENTLHEAGYFIRKHYKEWSFLKDKPIKEAIQGASSAYTQEKNIQLYGVPKSVSQAHLIGQILSKFSKDQLEKTAVVLGNESLLKPLLPCLPADRPANITMGSPLSEAALSHFIRALYELQSSGEKEGWYFQHLLHILHHPYAAILLDHQKGQGTSKLIHYLSEANLSYAHLNELVKQLPEARKVLTLLFGDVEDNAVLFLNQLHEICILLEQRATENNRATLASETHYFIEILEPLAPHLDQYPFVQSVKGFWRLFSERLHKIRIPYAGEALSGLQVMGMLESRNLDFETLVISDVNEGILPGGKSHNSFIPLSLKKEFGLPTFKEKDAVYAYHFYRLLQRAKEVHILYNTATDVLEGGEPSRFIHQLRTQKIPQVQVQHTLATPAIDPIKKQLVRISKNKQIIHSLTEKASRGFSPSAVNNYVRNPIEFYKNYVLKIEEPNPVEEIIAYNTFGTIVHESLDYLYTNYLNTPLKDTHFKEIKALIPQALTLKYEAFHSPLSGARGKNILAHRVILKYLEDFVSYDQKIASTEGLEIISLEKTYATTLHISGIDSPIKFKGTIDRVHKRNGQLEILDFKTGLVKASELKVKDWTAFSEEPKLAKALQLLSYAMVYQAEYPNTPLRAGIYSFKNTQPGILYFENTTGTTQKQLITSDTIDTFKAALEQIFLEIFNIEVPFVEKEV